MTATTSTTHNVPVAAKPGDKTTHVRIRVAYDKRRGCVSLAAYPVEQQPDGICIVLMTRGKHANGEPTPRLNRKQVEAAFEKYKQQIVNKSGPAYDLVMQLCDEYGLAIKE